MSAKAIIVEDDPNWFKIFNILVGELTADLFDYIHVNTFASLIEELENNKIELILLDLMLPDSYALSTLENISKYKIPTIIITTLDDEKLAIQAYQHGIGVYLVKDQYDLQVFLQACRKVIKDKTILEAINKKN